MVRVDTGHARSLFLTKEGDFLLRREIGMGSYYLGILSVEALTTGKRSGKDMLTLGERFLGRVTTTQ